MTWPTCRLVLRPRCKSDPGSCRQAVAGGGQGGSLHSTMTSRFCWSLMISSDMAAPPSLCLVVPTRSSNARPRSLSPREVRRSSSEPRRGRLDQVLAIERARRHRFLQAAGASREPCGMDGRRAGLTTNPRCR